MTKKTALKSGASGAAIMSFKGFDASLQCRGFQFEVGGTYEHEGRVEACESGFHACPEEQHPFSVFEFYPPSGSRYCRVTQSGDTDRHSDNKLASGRITIEAEIKIPELIATAIKWVFDRSKPEDGAQATGYQGAASATGVRGAASATGDQGAASATGDQGAASATGVRGAASATGVRGAASATGVRGASMSCGFEGRAKSAEGNAIFLVYRPSWDGEIEKVWAGIAGRDGVKADTWYALNVDGHPVEWTDA